MKVLLIIAVVLTLSFSSIQESFFDVQPASVIQAEGLEGIFECLYPGASSYSWLIDGNPLSLPPPSNVLVTQPSGDSPTARLIIPATPLYNNTVVHCIALVGIGGGSFVSVLSENATLTMQGPLSLESRVALNSAQIASNSITISWNPPFSLNLTTAEPDIQYCVDVYNITGGGDDHLQSVCDITVASFKFVPTSLNPAESLYLFTVTPRSNVEGSLNGTTSEPVQGYFCLGLPPINENSRVTFSTNVNLNPATITHNILQNDNFCKVTKSYLELDTLDRGNHYTQNCSLTLSSTTDPNTRLLAFNNITCAIERHKLYKMRIHEEYNGGSVISEWIDFSTHDVQNPNVQNQSSPGELVVKNSYLLETVDRGTFLILRSLIQTSEVYRASLRNKSETIITMNNLSSTKYSVFLYDLEPNGYPRSLPAASSQHVTLLSAKDVPNPSSESSLPDSFHISVTTSIEINGEICMSCSFSASELAGCVGVIHSAQLDNHTLTVLTVERSGGRDCIHMEEGNYSIAVFGQRDGGLNESPTLVKTVSVSPHSPTSISTGVVWLSLLVTIILITVVVVVLSCFIKVKKHKNRVTQSQSSNDIELVQYNRSECVSSEQEEICNLGVDIPDSPSDIDSPHASRARTSVGYSELDGENLIHADDSMPDTTSNSQVHLTFPGEQCDSAGVFAVETPQSVHSTQSNQLTHMDSQPDSIQTEHQQNDSLPPVSSLTVKSVATELYPIAMKWEEFGEEMRVPDSMLEFIKNDSNATSNKNRLFALLQYCSYNKDKVKYTWENIILVLNNMQQAEIAERIVSTQTRGN